MGSLRDLLPYLTGAGGAIAALVIGVYLLGTARFIPDRTHKSIVNDKDRQISDLTQALTRERERADSAVLAAQTTRDVLQALHQEAKVR